MKELKNTRIQLGEKKKVWVNVFRRGRKVVGKIFEPCEITNYKWQTSVRVGCCYALKADCDSFPEAVEKMGDFLECIHV